MRTPRVLIHMNFKKQNSEKLFGRILKTPLKICKEMKRLIFRDCSEVNVKLKELASEPIFQNNSKISR